MAQSLQKIIRVTADQWNRIEEATRERDFSPNKLATELAFEAHDRREWPRTEAETEAARASLFAAQFLARDLIRGRPRAGCLGDPGVHLDDHAGIRP